MNLFGGFKYSSYLCTQKSKAMVQRITLTYFTIMAEEKEYIIFNTEIEEDREGYEDFLEVNELTEEEYPYYEWVNEEVTRWAGDEKNNLNIPCNQVVCLGILGLWHGKALAFNVRENNVNSIFGTTACDDVKYYCDENDVRCVGKHHDGRNHYLFRELKDGITKEFFLTACEDYITNNSEWSEEFINKYTNSLRPKVAKVYGW